MREGGGREKRGSGKCVLDRESAEGVGARIKGAVPPSKEPRIMTSRDRTRRARSGEPNTKWIVNYQRASSTDDRFFFFFCFFRISFPSHDSHACLPRPPASETTLTRATGLPRASLVKTRVRNFSTTSTGSMGSRSSICLLMMNELIISMFMLTTLK